MPSNFRLSIASHIAAIAIGASAALAYLTVHAGSAGALARYVSAICGRPAQSASVAETAYLAENASLMTKMMFDMAIRPSGDVDTDFVEMMVPHHQAAVDMARAELRYGRNEALRRIAQEIMVTQLEEITAMRLSLGQRPIASGPSPDQITAVPVSDLKSGAPRQAGKP